MKHRSIVHSKLPVMENENVTISFVDTRTRESQFNEIYRLLYAPVYYFACRFVCNEDANDLTADAFLKLWNRDELILNLASAKNFLQISVRNAAIDRARRRKVARKAEALLRYLLPEGEDAAISLADTKGLLVKRLHAEIEMLPPAYRQSFKMAYLEEMKEREIAEKLGLSINTVHSHIVRSMAKLRLRMKSLDWLSGVVYFLLSSRSD